jgi:hypothetical protein
MFEALSNSFLADFITSFAYHKLILETVHIGAGMFAIGAIMVLAIRLLGFSKAVSVEQLGPLAFRLAWLGFAVVFLSGVAQFIPIAGDSPDAGPERNPIGLAYRWWFQVKMGAVLITFANLVWLHVSVRRHAAVWDATGAIPVAVRACALALIGLLPAIFVFARMMFAFLQATGVNSR